MLNHLGLRTAQFDALLAFYKATLAPIGYTVMMEYPGAAGLGKSDADFWIGADEKGGSNVHLAFKTDDRSVVGAFYEAALANGGKDNGAPGLRDYSPTYYAAFVIDPDGNNLEVFCTAAQ
ncbi:MAG: VOC family protein [Candidatus Devosia phytovorans]|uniref:VOC family protein n=1 Tax=Candidatus Devosia phytovorans TaxID=3121372 RepID=A0AAJ5VYM8_9HYPH|nr:VOC family protein [Devosia sp.]WEK06421.1 MAG: VOC family protein [Devosia sp.]